LYIELNTYPVFPLE